MSKERRKLYELNFQSGEEEEIFPKKKRKRRKRVVKKVPKKILGALPDESERDSIQEQWNKAEEE